jgi:predicted ATPase
MLTKLAIKNFRSIEEADIGFGPITVFFGPTAAGKSSLFYALLVLRNFAQNPNQAVDGFFNLSFQNLGGFDACVFNHLTSKGISVSSEFRGREDYVGSYGFTLRKAEVEMQSGFWSKEQSIAMSAKVPIPYALNQSFPTEYMIGENEFTINWNGVGATVSPKTPTASSQAQSKIVARDANLAVEALKAVDVCPHRRGFFKPNYTAVPLSPLPTSEDEVATLIINDQNAAPRISIDTADIFDRDFRTYTPPGTATTFLQTTEIKGSRIPTLLVNDGFGVNQVVYMLAKIHRPEVETVLIEEPEVHLHPTIVRKFVRVAARLVNEEQKQLVFTTHSEQFLLSLLACVKEELLTPEQLRCYHVTRPKKQTTFSVEPVSKDGQITGGLSSFVEAELEDIKMFLSAEAH